jgi:enamine deaminase RidA (YjgF/YER057c/UK114 family)
LPSKLPPAGAEGFREPAWNCYNIADFCNPTNRFSILPGDPMTPEQRALDLNIQFPSQQPGYLNLCANAGNLLITSGHVSDMKGKLGDDLATADGYEAAKQCAIKILQSVHARHGTLNGLRVVKLLGCVNSTPDFIEHHLVINGASDLFHTIFGKETDGYHARSAVGFVSLPTGVAVEVEAIFEILPQ